MNLLNYASILFDCDGVILDSNKIKSSSFYNTAAKYCESAALQLLEYHKLNGGISRYVKFQYFINEILPFNLDIDKQQDIPLLNTLLHQYAQQLKEKLLICPVAEGLDLLRQETSKTDWYVITGGDEDEVKEIFRLRKIDKYFNMGIHGSPKSKDEIMTNLISEKKIRFPAIFLGDSIYDYRIASKFGIHFIFISGWTELKDWDQFVRAKSINHTEKIKNLIPKDCNNQCLASDS